MSFKVAKVLDVAQGVQEDQFTVVSREDKESLDDLDPVYRQLLDEPVTAVIAVMGGDGRPWLTPVWFNYAGDKVCSTWPSTAARPSGCDATRR